MGGLRTASVKIQHELVAEGNRPRLRVGATFSHEQ